MRGVAYYGSISDLSVEMLPVAATIAVRCLSMRAPWGWIRIAAAIGAISHRTLGYPTVALTAEVFLIEIRFLRTIRARLYGKFTMDFLARALRDGIAHQSL